MRAIVICLTIFVLAVVCGVGLFVGVRAESEATYSSSTGGDLASLAIAGVKDNSSRIRSGRISYFYIAFARGGDTPDSSANPDTRTYIEGTLVFDKEKFKESAREGETENDLNEEYECFFDGNMSGLHLVDEERAFVWNGWSDPIVGSSISYTLALPYSYQIESPTVYEKLVASSPNAMGEITVDGLECIRLEGKGLNGRRQTWYVCPDYGSAIIKSERETEVSYPEREFAYWETVNSDFAQFNGVWLPRRQQIAVVHNAADGSVTRQVMFSIALKSVDINPDIHPGEFKLNLTPKTKVTMKD